MRRHVKRLKESIAFERSQAEKWAKVYVKAKGDYAKGFAFQRSKEHYKTVFALYDALEQELIERS